MILIVDNNENIRRFLTTNLNMRGYETVEAGTAEEGLVTLRRLPLEAILLEIRLPGMDGWEMLSEMAASKEAIHHIPVIVLTTSMCSLHERLREYPQVMRTLLKPISAQKLVDTIDSVLKDRIV